jgi:hypothetical protein
MNKRKGIKTKLDIQAENAFKRAVAAVLRERRLHGEPIAVWKNGRAVWVKV